MVLLMAGLSPFDFGPKVRREIHLTAVPNGVLAEIPVWVINYTV